MTDRTEPSPEPDRTSGYCLVCRDYGYGTYAGIRTALTDWIVDHVGCAAPVPPGALRIPDDRCEDRWA
ncbi:hypothetical protein [Kitasatospora sp. NBC_00458]|uniref:hypothetical protein n=1 Tax=Kitasatospora sp. NBC_00458 TaxID=2903568 RepID=UPI002E1931A8